MPTPTPTIGESPEAAEEFRFLALGDSYTIGESVAVEGRWPVQLARRLQEEGINVAEPEIIARTGWTTGQLLAAMGDAGLSGPYGLVTLLIGVNNQFRGLDVDDFRVDLVDLLQRAVELAGSEPSRVIVLSIPDWGVTPFPKGADRSRIAREIDLFNAVKRDETTRIGSSYVDVRQSRGRPKRTSASWPATAFTHSAKCTKRGRTLCCRWRGASWRLGKCHPPMHARPAELAIWPDAKSAPDLR